MREKERNLLSTNVCLERERERYLGGNGKGGFGCIKGREDLRVCLAPFGVSNKHEFFVFYFVFFVFLFFDILFFWSSVNYYFRIC